MDDLGDTAKKAFFYNIIINFFKIKDLIILMPYLQRINKEEVT